MCDENIDALEFYKMKSEYLELQKEHEECEEQKLEYFREAAEAKQQLKTDMYAFIAACQVVDKEFGMKSDKFRKLVNEEMKEYNWGSLQ